MTGKARVTGESLSDLAERMLQRYVRGLVSVDEFTARLRRAWQFSIKAQGTPDEVTLEALARGLCNQILYEGCQLPAGYQRDLAFERLSEYLERALGDIGDSLNSRVRETREEIIQQTLVEILQSMQREGGKPEQPLAFLGWARVILRRQLTLYWRKQARLEEISLEQQDDAQSVVEYIDEHALDPLAVVLRRELREELQAAIAELRNSAYQAVLLNLYFRERDAPEVANLLQVHANKIHLWHHRGLQALQKRMGRSGKAAPQSQQEGVAYSSLPPAARKRKPR